MRRKLIKTLERAYHSLPADKRIWVGRVIFPLRFIVNGITNICFQLYKIEGNDRSFCFITSSRLNPSFIEQFSNNAKITKIGELYLWDLIRFGHPQDMLIIEMHKYLVPFFKDGLVTIPWVRQILDLQIPIENIIQHIRERKKISQFQVEISTDINDLKKFLDIIYTPYILERYPNALISDFDFEIFKKRWLKNSGELLFIKKNDIQVGGIYCELIDNTYYFCLNGLIDKRFLKEGAMAAIYFFSILRAKERKALYLDFGLSRPFLTDGVLSYKRKWQAKIYPNNTNHVVYLKNFKKDGLIVLEDKKLKVIVLSKKNASLPLYLDSGLDLKIIEPNC
jgi:hypothetical protein